MAPTETNAKPKRPESSKADDKPETAQNPSTDPSTTSHLQQTVNKSSELTGPATMETLRGATKPSSMKQSSATGGSDVPTEVFMPTNFVAERK